MRDTEATEIWNKLLSKPMQMMTEHERIVHAVNVFLVDFEFGGWFYNVSPDASENQLARYGSGCRDHRCLQCSGTPHRDRSDC